MIKDPPFTKLDLISCRNLLIYLELELQTRVIPAFHYALRPGGVLFLGTSEGVGDFNDLFAPVDSKWKIYRVNPSSLTTQKRVAQHFGWTKEKFEREPSGELSRNDKINYAELSKQALLQSFAPPSVITDEKGDILYVQGDTGKYLRPAQGHPSTNIIDMAREGLQRELRLAIQKVTLQKRTLVERNVPVKTNGGMHGVDLTVRPLADPNSTRELLFISFQDTELPPLEKRVLTY